MASIRREAQPRDPPGSRRGLPVGSSSSAPVCYSADPPTSFQAAPPFPPLRSSPSNNPSLAVPSSLRHLLDGVDSSSRPRMTDTWPLPCMNKSGHSGHLPKAMPGQLITVNHTPATYEHTSTRESSGLGKQGSRPTEREEDRRRNGQAMGKRSIPGTCSINHRSQPHTSGYRRECPRVECARSSR